MLAVTSGRWRAACAGTDYTDRQRKNRCWHQFGPLPSQQVQAACRAHSRTTRNPTGCAGWYPCKHSCLLQHERLHSSWRTCQLHYNNSNSNYAIASTPTTTRTLLPACACWLSQHLPLKICGYFRGCCQLLALQIQWEEAVSACTSACHHCQWQRCECHLCLDVLTCRQLRLPHNWKCNCNL